MSETTIVGRKVRDLELTPETALVLLWHWTQTPSPEVPAWCRQHPAWPANFNPGDQRRGHLIRFARPLIRQIEGSLSPEPRHD